MGGGACVIIIEDGGNQARTAADVGDSCIDLAAKASDSTIAALALEYQKQAQKAYRAALRLQSKLETSETSPDASGDF